MVSPRCGTTKFGFGKTPSVEKLGQSIEIWYATSEY
jgi:hypothetical protein